jgi:ribosome biogenesis GTPase A
MKTMLSSIDLIIECRDYRVPLTSRNPLFEQSLNGRERLVVYTKRDLGSKDRASDREVYEYYELNWYMLTISYSEKILFVHGIVLPPSFFPTINRNAT